MTSSSPLDYVGIEAQVHTPVDPQDAVPLSYLQSELAKRGIFIVQTKAALPSNSAIGSAYYVNADQKLYINQGTAGWLAVNVQGADGVDGVSYTFGGHVADQAALTALQNVKVGVTYFVDSTGEMQAWTGVKWIDLGHIQGPQGPAGGTGPQGPAGADGAKGVKGDTGATGSQGPAGIAGPKGNPGIQGLVGAAGPKGDPGTAGAKGDQGDRGLQGAQGIQGVKGADGSDGAPGTAGPAGATSTITVGKVSTGPVPSVTNSGTVQNATFDFVFPEVDQAALTKEIADRKAGDIAVEGKITAETQDRNSAITYLLGQIKTSLGGNTHLQSQVAELVQKLDGHGLFIDHLEERDIINMANPSATTKGNYYIWTGTEDYIIRSSDQPIAPALTGRKIQPGDWIIDQGTRYTIIRGDMMNYHRWVDLGTFQDFNDHDHYERGSLVRRNGLFYRANQEILPNSGDPNVNTSGWLDITPSANLGAHRLSELLDVDPYHPDKSTYQDADILVYDLARQTWKVIALENLTKQVLELEDLMNVTVEGGGEPKDGDVLTYDHSQGIWHNETPIDAATKANLAAAVSRISTNETNISNNTSEITAIKGKQSQDETAIAANKASSASNKSDITAVQSRVGQNESDIKALAVHVGHNESDLASLTNTLEEDTDTTITNPQDGEVLAYHGGKWVNQAAAAPVAACQSCDHRYDASATYVTGDIVEYQGKTYVVKDDLGGFSGWNPNQIKTFQPADSQSLTHTGYQAGHSADLAAQMDAWVADPARKPGDMFFWMDTTNAGGPTHPLGYYIPPASDIIPSKSFPGYQVTAAWELIFTDVPRSLSIDLPSGTLIRNGCLILGNHLQNHNGISLAANDAAAVNSAFDAVKGPGTNSLRFQLIGEPNAVQASSTNQIKSSFTHAEGEQSVQDDGHGKPSLMLPANVIHWTNPDGSARNVINMVFHGTVRHIAGPNAAASWTPAIYAIEKGTRTVYDLLKDDPTENKIIYFSEQRRANSTPTTPYTTLAVDSHLHWTDSSGGAFPLLMSASQDGTTVNWTNNQVPAGGTGDFKIEFIRTSTSYWLMEWTYRGDLNATNVIGHAEGAARLSNSTVQKLEAVMVTCLGVAIGDKIELLQSHSSY